MKMIDVKVGMRLKSTQVGAFSPIEVTEITEKGFKYKLDKPHFLMPGHTVIEDGHEHYGFNGETVFYELE
jgi:hypothetical protein